MTERRVRRTREEMPSEANGRDRVKLLLTREQYSYLFEEVSAKPNRPDVRISREALRALLLDYSKMVDKFRGELGGYL